ncbi:major capsid protein [Pseudomonas aeruginosa]|nr:major capsid protein [Pseudomonas aeruginosa]
MRGTYLNTLQAAQLRGDRRQSFEFGGVVWERYRGKHDGEPFVDDGSAQLVPEGVPDLFISAFAPADRMEVVNTEGVPYYAKLERLPFDKGVAGKRNRTRCTCAPARWRCANRPSDRGGFL